MTMQERKRVVEILRMATRNLLEMPMSELLRLSRTVEGRAFLLEEAQTIEGLLKQVYVALGSDSPLPLAANVERGVPKAASHDLNATTALTQRNENDVLRVSDLIAGYRTNKASGYGSLRYRTRQNYDGLLRRIKDKIGSEFVQNIDAEFLQRLYEEWIDGSKVAMGHSLMSMLRGLASFGATELKNKDCIELKFRISEMKVPAAGKRKERLTMEQVLAIIAEANAKGLPSIAMAQAFQSNFLLLQRDIIGEWVPLASDPEKSDVRDGNMKWLRGLRWEEIDQNYILRHRSSRSGKMLEIDLKPNKLIMTELQRPSTKRGSSGPVIVFEKSGRPYLAHQFREVWREVASSVSIPPHVYNMDSRVTPDRPNVTGHPEEIERATEDLLSVARH